MDFGPWLGDSAVGLLQDLVIGGTGAGIARSAARVMWLQPPGFRVP
jgi:hypothetical protein